jgi:hypothetical protein
MAAAPPSESFTIRKSAVRQVVTTVVIIAALAGIALFVVTLARTVGPRDPLAAAINPSEYQAVFLTNGQVYFGKLEAPGGDFYYLRHIYYLASQVSPQGAKAPQQNLIKLGNEIHGPEDLMVINRSQILFVENLKPSGRVSRAINRSPTP